MARRKTPVEPEIVTPDTQMIWEDLWYHEADKIWATTTWFLCPLAEWKTVRHKYKHWKARVLSNGVVWVYKVVLNFP